ncbi:DUF2895 family protein [Photobacterium leiognathi]|uniref:DUF2895 family protein n=1 Tax=Photobacterium leiognathi TaxID=553611 RepID=UPI0027391E74|nr:DUF2895 family protein [Photobacterium leiognathi]
MKNNSNAPKNSNVDKAKPRSKGKRFQLPKKHYRYTDEVNEHIKTLRIGGLILSAVIAFGGVCYYRFPSTILLYNTPNVTGGETRTIEQVPAFSVYSFALYVMQQVYNTGDLDTGIDKNIIAYSSFISPEFQQQLKIKNKIDKQKAIAVKGVTQEVREMSDVRFNDDQIFQLSPSKWVVYLDLEVVDRLNGQIIKDADIRYPVVVEKADFNPTLNPIGLRLTGFYQDPTRINSKDTNNENA